MFIDRAMTKTSQTVLYLHGIVRRLKRPKVLSLIIKLATICGARSKHCGIVYDIIT